uniref:BHLH domain-containing protein n=1 Tax=Chenopodium quinoa TaxID=63459 RepID=A0A803MJ83_CHEQI
MCPFVPTLGLEYPIELETYDQVLLDNNYLNLDSIFLPNILLSQAQDDSNNNLVKIKQRKSPLSTSLADHQFGAAVTTTTTMKRKINHNASERDRRKKINVLYSSLRDLLPPTDQIVKCGLHDADEQFLYSADFDIIQFIDAMLQYVMETQE